jgi:Rnl2 family RNA ligase
MDFHKYNKMENIGTCKSGINNFDNDSEYIVTEKAHGTHMSFDITKDGTEYIITACSRNRALTEDLQFYNHTQIVESLREKLTSICDDIFEDTIQKISIHGELIGGNYPHVDVEKTKDVSIQKGIFYAPCHVYYAYDIYVYTEDEGHYMNYDEAIELFEKYDIFYAKILCRGSWNIVKDYSNDFESHIPIDLGYPPINGNKAEGVVIKTLNDMRLPNGKRMILKNKTPKFSENKKKKSKANVEDTPEVKAVKDNVLSLINVNRLEAVISKIGEVTSSDIGRIMKDMREDIITDYSIEYDNTYNDLDAKDKKSVNKFISSETIILIKEWFSSA